MADLLSSDCYGSCRLFSAATASYKLENLIASRLGSRASFELLITILDLVLSPTCGFLTGMTWGGASLSAAMLLLLSFCGLLLLSL